MKLTKKTFINALALIMLGAALGYMIASKRCRGPWYGSHADREAYYLSVYTDKLNLTEEQQEQVKGIIRTRSNTIATIMKEMRPRFQQARTESDAAIEKILDDKQRSEFKKLQAKFDEYRKKRWGKRKSDHKS